MTRNLTYYDNTCICLSLSQCVTHTQIHTQTHHCSLILKRQLKRLSLWSLIVIDVEQKEIVSFHSSQEKHFEAITVWNNPNYWISKHTDFCSFRINNQAIWRLFYNFMTQTEEKTVFLCYKYLYTSLHRQKSHS